MNLYNSKKKMNAAIKSSVLWKYSHLIGFFFSVAFFAALESKTDLLWFYLMNTTSWQHFEDVKNSKKKKYDELRNK